MNKKLLLSAGLCLMIAQPAIAAPVLSDFVVFGKTSVTIGQNTGAPVNAAVGSGGSVTIQQNGQLGDGNDAIILSGGGAYTGGNNGNYVGDIIFSGSVNLGNGSQVTGNIHSGGSVTTNQGVKVSGDVIATGNISLAQNNQIGGVVHAGGNASLGNNTTVGGTASAGGTVALGNNASTGGVINGAAAPTPLSPASIVMPSANVFSAGGTNYSYNNNQQLALSEGTYGAVSFKNNGKLTLTSGVYYFDSFNFGNNGLLELDLTGGDILINIVGNLTGGNNFDIALIGGDPFDVLFEIHGNVKVDQNSDWYGTIFAPNSTVEFGQNATITGAIYGDIIKIDQKSTFSYAASNRLFPQDNGNGGNGDDDDNGPNPSEVPAPAPLASILFGLMALGYISRRRIVA